MRGTRLAAVAAGAFAVLATALVGVGQDNLGLGGAGDPLKLTLLRLPAVQKELELTPQQLEKIEDLGEQTKEARKQIEAASKGEGQPKAKGKDADPVAKAALEASYEDLEQQSDQKLAKILDKKQRTRLSQLALRVEGPAAFVEPELIQALNLGDDQVEAIREVLDGLRDLNEQYKESLKQAGELTKDLGDGPELEKIRKDQDKGRYRTHAYAQSKRAMTLIGKILTRRQRDNYNKLLGPPFELNTLADAKGRPLFDAADITTRLLRQPAVREELKLTDAQQERLDRHESPAKVLDARQRTRLNQLALQSEGPSALGRPDVQKALRLGVEQVEEIMDLLDGGREEGRQLRELQKAEAERLRAESGPLDPLQAKARKEQEKEQLRTAGAGLRTRLAGQINRLLTRSQKEAYSRLLGEPFDFVRLRRDPNEKAKVP